MKPRGTAKIYNTIDMLRKIFIYRECPTTGAEEAIMWWANNIIDEESYYRGMDKPEPLWKPERIIIIRPGESAGERNMYCLLVYCDSNDIITDISTGS